MTPEKFRLTSFPPSSHFFTSNHLKMAKKYLDTRDIDREKSRPVTPAQWQARFQDEPDWKELVKEEPPAKRIKTEKGPSTTERVTEDTGAKEVPVKSKVEKRKRYKAEDFTYKDSQRAQVDCTYLVLFSTDSVTY